MNTSPNLQLPYILPDQAQKHVTHNDAIRTLDALVQLSVLSRIITTPPPASQNGDRYIIGPAAIDDWAGKENSIAAFQDGAWAYLVPQVGWLTWVSDENQVLAWEGNAWDSVHRAPNLQNVPLIGVNTTADSTNKLSINSDATLLNNDGNGHQLKINKNVDTDTASLLFQSQFTGHAEIGLTGDNDVHVKVSDDGVVWNEAIKIDRQNGHVILPNIRSGTISIGDDAVGYIQTPQAGGFLLLTIVSPVFPQASHSGIFVYDSGPSLNLYGLALATNMTNNGTAILTGTTGTDGQSNIAVSSGQIQIENRFGGTRSYSYTFIG